MVREHAHTAEQEGGAMDMAEQSEVRRERLSNSDLATRATQARGQEAQGSGPSEADLAKAKAKLEGFLGGNTGAAAVTAVFAEADEDRDGLLNKDELHGFLSTVGLGNFITRGLWAAGLLKSLRGDHGAPAGGADRASLGSFLAVIGLG